MLTQPVRRRHFRWSRRPWSRRGAGLRRVVGVFDLLLTPWFAVGVGLVIAAAAGAATPRAELTFAPGTSTARCHLMHCAAVRAKDARDEVGAHGGTRQVYSSGKSRGRMETRRQHRAYRENRG